MWVRRLYQRVRIFFRQLTGAEPVVRVAHFVRTESHGNEDGNWSICANSLDADSVVVDVGLGEDTEFSESLIRKYSCNVNGFDPTPRAIKYVRTRANDKLRLYEVGLGAKAGVATFYLPNDDRHVSGSVDKEQHLGRRTLDVSLVTIDGLLSLIGTRHIDLLKMDIEGSEYDVISSVEFQKHAGSIGQLCIEFHHRWGTRGRRSTEDAVRTLRQLGFECIWRSRYTNEEFTFLNTRRG